MTARFCCCVIESVHAISQVHPSNNTGRHHGVRVDISAVWRDDGIRFLRNTDGTYSMEAFDFVEGKEKTEPYRYELGRLLKTGQFTFWPPLSSGRNLCKKAGE